MRFGALIGALWYLQTRQFLNVVKVRVRRLRNPKYLVGAVFGVAYFYSFFIRRLVIASSPGPHSEQFRALGDAVHDFFQNLAPVLLFLVVAATWVFTGPEATVSFTETELSFLLPAPLTRQWLVRYRLIRSVAQILFSAVIFSLVMGRTNVHNFWYRLAGWWIILATLNLHGVGAGFTIQRLTESGMASWRRRVATLVVALAVFGSVAVWLRSAPPPPAPVTRSMSEPGEAGQVPAGGRLADEPRSPIGASADRGRRVVRAPVEAVEGAGEENFSQYERWLNQAVRSGPGLYLFAPFRWVVAPWFATSLAGFLQSLLPAVGLLALHLWWVDSSDASFEEASLAKARRRADVVASMRAGKGLSLRKKKALRPLFPLDPIGWPGTAFVWRRLLGARVSRGWIRWLAAGVALVLFGPLLLSEPGRAAVGFVALVGVGLATFLPAMFATSVTAREFPSFEVFKTYPVPGWQILAGHLLGGAVGAWIAQIVLVLVCGAWFDLSAFPAVGGRIELFSILVGCLLVAIPGSLVFTALPTASALLFPGWVRIRNEPQTGFEVMGPRLLLMIGLALVLAVVLVPAGGVGLLGWWLGGMMGGAPGRWLLGGLSASVVLVAEAGLAFWGLGQLFERFDVTEEL